MSLQGSLKQAFHLVDRLHEVGHRFDVPVPDKVTLDEVDFAENRRPRIRLPSMVGQNEHSILNSYEIVQIVTNDEDGLQFVRL